MLSPLLLLLMRVIGAASCPMRVPYRTVPYDGWCAASYSLTFQYTFQKSIRIIKPRILVEIIDQYSEMNNIAYGIVAYSFVSRYSCLEFNCVFLKYMIHGYMILCYIA